MSRHVECEACDRTPEENAAAPQCEYTEEWPGETVRCVRDVHDDPAHRFCLVRP